MSLTLRSVVARTGFALAVIIAAGLVAFACGDDDDSGTATPTSSSEETASPTDGDASSTPAVTSTPGATPGSTADAELRKLVRAWLDGVNGKVVYDYKSTFGQHPDGVYTTYFLDGKDRNDWLDKASGFGVTVVTMLADDQPYVCTLTQSNPTCRETPEQEVYDTRAVFLIVLQVAEIVADGVNGATVTALDSEDVAGVPGECYVLTSPGRVTAGPDGTEELKYCFSADGLLLSFYNGVFFEDDSLDKSELNLTAIEVDEATLGDFEPPAEVIN